MRVCWLAWVVFASFVPSAVAQNTATLGGINAPIFSKKTGHEILLLTPAQIERGYTALSEEERRRLPGDEFQEIRRQMDEDPVPIPPRMGAIFVPEIIRNQPNVIQTTYLVYDLQGKQVSITKTGRKTFLLPGRYQVQVGAKATDLFPPFSVQVERDKIATIRARWSSLIVRVQDELLVQFRGTYDIIHLESRRSVGTGIGADDRLGEKVRPWILPPGLYMIVQIGDTYLARANYTTVQLNEGKTTLFGLVVDRTSGRFLGSGVILQEQLGYHRRGIWNWSFQLSGNFLWNHLENVPAASTGHSFSLTTFLAGRVSLNTERHFFLAILNTELGFTAPSLQDFRKSADRLQLEAIYIVRLLPWLGPYIRFGMETNLFPGYYYVSTTDSKNPVSVYLCDDPALCSLSKSVPTGGRDQLPLSSFFDPLLFKEGVGINLQAFQYTWLDLRLLLGFGFRQELAREVYQFSSSPIRDKRCSDPTKRDPKKPWEVAACPVSSNQESHNHLLFFRKFSSHREGIELALVATGRIGTFLTFTSEFDALLQFTDFLDFDIDWRNTITLRLSHYVSIFYRLRIRRDPAIPGGGEVNKWYLDQSAVLSFSILF